MKLGLHEVLKEEAHGFVIPIHPRKGGLVNKNVFLTGDAAGLADPITAEGISNAIASGVMAANAIAESGLNVDRAKKLYTAKLEEKILPELRTAAQLAKLFYGQKSLRNLLLKKHGQKATDYMTNIFMGNRSYPDNFFAEVKKRLRLPV